MKKSVVPVVMLVFLVVVGLVFVWFFKSNSSQAVVGVEECRLCGTEKMEKCDQKYSAGTRLTVVAQTEDLLKVKAEGGIEYWAKRIWLCTEKELATRQSQRQVPIGITIIGKQDGQDTIHGDIYFSNGQPALKVGSALWYDQRFREAEKETTIDGHTLREFYLEGEEVKRSIEWLIRRIVKVASRVSHHGRYWWVYVASAFPFRHHFQAVLGHG